MGWSSTGQYDGEMKKADDQYGPIYKKFQSEAIMTVAANSEAKDNRLKAAELDKLKVAQMSDLERTQAELAAIRTEAESARAEALRWRIAASHGISDADVADSPLLEDLAGEIVQQVEGCDLCGFNVLRFDLPFLSEDLFRAGITWDTANLRVVDAMRIYHHFERRDLSAASRFYLEREHAGAHDALADVEVTLDVLLAQLERYPELAPDVPSLGEFCGDRKRAPDAAGGTRSR